MLCAYIFIACTAAIAQENVEVDVLIGFDDDPDDEDGIRLIGGVGVEYIPGKSLTLHFPNSGKYLLTYMSNLGTFEEWIGIWQDNGSQVIKLSPDEKIDEAYILKKPCITLRENTEWVETIKEGWNILVYTNKNKIQEAIMNFNPKKQSKLLYGDGKASLKIVKILEKS